MKFMLCSFPSLLVTVTCMVSFGDSKHEPVKPLHRLIDVTHMILALSAKCTIHDVGVSCFVSQPNHCFKFSIISV